MAGTSFIHWEDELPGATFDSETGEWTAGPSEPEPEPSAIQEPVGQADAAAPRRKSNGVEICSGMMRNPFKSQPAEDRAHPEQHLEFKVATFNLWYATDYFEERTAATLAILHEEAADVVCLQEVTPAFLERLLAEQWVRDDYTVSHKSHEQLSVLKYATVMLTKLEVVRFSVHDLPSFMDRKLVVGEFRLGAFPLVVATVHLESECQAETRQHQMYRMSSWLQDKDGSYLIAGDFNFDAAADENQAMDNYHWLDVWPELKPHQEGYTRDTKVNSLLRLQYPEGLQARFDRIIAHNGEKGSYVVQPVNIKRLGLMPVSADLPDVHPSDHFGLSGSFYIMSHEESKRHKRQNSLMHRCNLQ